MSTRATDKSQLSAALLRMENIHKSFPGVHALRGVSLTVQPGEVHALLGENGAGKSTLMHILAGVYQPDKGTIDFDGGRSLTIADEHQAQQLGIGIVYQERSLFSHLTVAENIFASGLPVNRWGVIDRTALLNRSRQVLQRLGQNIDPKAPLSRLSPAQQQMVEIAKALVIDAKLLIFDEPTAALTEPETASLFRVIRQMKDEGVGIVYISHRLEEIFEIAGRVTVLRDGQYQGTFGISETNPRDLVSRMVGRVLLEHDFSPAPVPEGSRIVLEVRHLSDHGKAEPGAENGSLLKDISFTLKSGEILALAGLAGAGRTELALSLFGARPYEEGEVRIEGRTVQIRCPEEAISAGLGYVPEDRKEAGLFLNMSVADNIAAARLGHFGRWKMDDQKRDRVAAGFIQKLRIVTPSVATVAGSLSGGNQQKVVLARWLLLNPAVLIVDEPTRGIDVAAKAEVHALVHQLARQGTAVILISSDLPEVLALADRTLVMRRGRICGELSRHDASEEKIMHFAAMAAEVTA
ncbi:MAG: sugar ABC transporter ATP-binding protein [Acidobacteria bacterium]|nr:sugar ABC transporter ATP-binding protein [Acidobacteriota bacterium]MCI0718043.1 sugar ABC transporter ATP-binding protein [Acidobacteriota bacterium]